MSEREPYTPLSERLQQDVWHDNFVPKYSALATAAPSKLVLIGVWLIFLPMAVTALLMAMAPFSAPDKLSAVITFLLAAATFVLAVAILFSQTRRYIRAQSQTDDHHDDEP